MITGSSKQSVLASADSKTNEASRITETGILHDHMYNKLESEIGASLVDIGKIKDEDLGSQLAQHPLVRVSGRITINDYERMSSVYSNFNELGEAMASIPSLNESSLKEQLALIERQFPFATSAKRKELEKQAMLLINARKLAQEKNLWLPQQFLEAFSLLVAFFKGSRYDIIVSIDDKTPIKYRGAIDKTWLRLSPEMMSQLYTGYSNATWIMVGVVTNIPASILPRDIHEEEEQSENSNMAWALNNMFRLLIPLETEFIAKDEITISPIAVYREFTLPSPED